MNLRLDYKNIPEEKDGDGILGNVFSLVDLQTQSFKKTMLSHANNILFYPDMIFKSRLQRKNERNFISTSSQKQKYMLMHV